MKILLKHKKGQHLLEYALVIALVAAAAMAMRVYVQRAAQGSIRILEEEALKEPCAGNDCTTYDPPSGGGGGGGNCKPAGAGCLVWFICPVYSCPPLPKCCGTCVAVGPPQPNGQGGICQ